MTVHHVTSDGDDVTVTSSPARPVARVSSAAGSSLSTSSVMPGRGQSSSTPVSPVNPLSLGYVTAALVLGLLCVVLGVVYGYIHFTRVNPRFRVRLLDHHSAASRYDTAHNASTHIFLRNAKSIQAL